MGDAWEHVEHRAGGQRREGRVNRGPGQGGRTEEE